MIKEGNTVPMMDSNGNRMNGSVLEVKDDIVVMEDVYKRQAQRRSPIRRRYRSPRKPYGLPRPFSVDPRSDTCLLYTSLAC